MMDRESYEDASLAQVINEHFVAVVDRDSAPMWTAATRLAVRR